MSDRQEVALDVQELVASIEDKVAERVARGDYPDDTMQELEAHFQRLVTTRPAPERQPTGLDGELSRLWSEAHQPRCPVQADSNIPGGATLHKIIGRVMSRQVQVLGERIDATYRSQHLSLGAVAEILAEMAAQHARSTTSLWRRVDGLLDDIAQLTRHMNRLESTVAAPATSRRSVADVEVRRLLDAFVANRDAEDLHVLAGELEGYSPVLDVGAGTGEFLVALRDRGVTATGVEWVAPLGEAATACEVVVASPATHLASLDDRSMGGISLVHALERLRPVEAIDVLHHCARVLRPRGALLVVTDEQATLPVDDAVPRAGISWWELASYVVGSLGYSDVHRVGSDSGTRSRAFVALR